VGQNSKVRTTFSGKHGCAASRQGGHWEEAYWRKTGKKSAVRKRAKNWGKRNKREKEKKGRLARGEVFDKRTKEGGGEIQKKERERWQGESSVQIS